MSHLPCSLRHAWKMNKIKSTLQSMALDEPSTGARYSSGAHTLDDHGSVASYCTAARGSRGVSPQKRAVTRGAMGRVETATGKQGITTRGTKKDEG